MVSYPIDKNAHIAIPPAIVLLSVCAIFLVSVAFVGIEGDFPLNDDWAYAATVRDLLIKHEWRPSDWAAMTLFSQTLWGASFCAFSSCSFELLRISSLVAMAITILACFASFNMASAETPLLLLGLLVVAFNPVAFSLSYTFMTDPFFTMAIAVSLYFFLLSLKNERTAYLCVAVVAAVAATLCRQVGLCMPAAYAVVRLLKPGRETLLRRLSAAALPLLVCGLIYLGFAEWMRLTGRQALSYNKSAQEIGQEIHNIPQVVSSHIIDYIGYRISVILLYMGLFLSPILLVTKLPEPAAGLWRRWASIAISLALVSLSIYHMIYRGSLMPIGINIFAPEGIGPLTLRDTLILQQADIAKLPIGFWLAVTAISLLGQFLLVQRIVDYLIAVFSRRRGMMLDSSDVQPLMALLAAAIYCAPVVLVPTLFDRYLVPLAPLLAYWLLATGRLAWTTALAPALSALACATSVVYSVLGTHDYMAWNRARWQALTDLERAGAADFRTVDGGFEYNGLRGYDGRYKPPPEKSWWWVRDDPYVISFGAIAGYDAVERYQYVNYLLPGLRTVYLLHRDRKAATR